MDDSERRVSLGGTVLARPALKIRGGALGFGSRVLWRQLELSVERGEFIAVLGANGSGKSSLLKTILGLQKLDSGSILIDGDPARRGDRRIGYIPQQRILLPGTPLRGRDLVTLGLTGDRFGLPLPRAGVRERVDVLLESVGARSFADHPVGHLSGGEQQRLRVAQALAGDPLLLLCDEPLLSLDLQNQRAVASLIDERRREHATAVLFVTHDVNPVLDAVDRVLYLAGGKFSIGPPDAVLTSEVLSTLYETPVEVLRVGGRVLVIGTPDSAHHGEGHQ